MSIWNRENLSFGFLSTRFAGTDGVSLETEKWVDVLRGRGCSVYYLAGELDTEPELSHHVPKAFFQHDEIMEVQRARFLEKRRTRSVSRKVYELKEELKDELEQYSSRSPVSRPSPIITTSTGRGSAFTLLR